MVPLEFFASCMAGAERSLAEELRTLDIERVRPLKGGVAFFCGPEGAYRACLWSRLASRILLVLGRFDAPDADALYEGVAAVPWEEVLADGATFTVRAHGTNAQLRNTRFTALKAKDAVADRLRGRRGLSEAGGQDGLRAAIDVRLRGERATVSLDFCGEALSRRPYLFDDDGPEAPLRCALAATALALGGWDAAAGEGAPLVDPACGDGILLVEAAAVACDRAPALGRSRWGFECWAGFDRASWEALEARARERFEQAMARIAGDDPRGGEAPVRFVGTSTSSPAIARGRKYLRRAGLRGAASIEIGDSTAASEVVARARRAAGNGSDGTCFIACNIASTQRADAAAAVRADEAAVVSAVREAGDRCVTIVVDAAQLISRFPQEARSTYRVGSGRSEAVVEVFRGPLSQARFIEVIGLDTGEPQRIEVMEATSDQFAARLRKVFKERRKQAGRQQVSCYRIYDYDLPEYAVAIDWYQGAGDARGNSYLVIAEYAPPASVDEAKALRRFQDVLAIAAAVCGVRPDHIFSKRRERQKGGGQYRRPQGRPYETTVEEGGYLFQVDLARRLDTGLFLDHRLTRALVGQKAWGRDFLNLFAYTGAATVHAAGGGAASTTTVDLSQTYLDQARRNMEANGFSGAAHRFEKSDVMKWITQARRDRRRFGLIFVDPPTFSNSKAMGRKTWDVQRDHVELLIGVAHLLEDGGEAVFSCNLRSFKPDTEALAKHGIQLAEITDETIPFDFVRTPRIHRCYLMTCTR